MANKRNLKREINYICSEMFAECVALSLYNNANIEESNVDSLLKSIMDLHSDYIMRVSHPEPGMKPREYYRCLVDSFNNDANEVVDQICNLY